MLFISVEAKRLYPRSVNSYEVCRTFVGIVPFSQVVSNKFGPVNDLLDAGICVTNDLYGESHKKDNAKLLALGAKVTGSVSKNIDIVIAGSKAGSKLTKVEELGITVWDEARILEFTGGKD